MQSKPNIDVGWIWALLVKQSHHLEGALGWFADCKSWFASCKSSCKSWFALDLQTLINSALIGSLICSLQIMICSDLHVFLHINSRSDLQWFAVICRASLPLNLDGKGTESTWCLKAKSRPHAASKMPWGKVPAANPRRMYTYLLELSL